MFNCVRILGKCSVSWHCRRRAGLRKAILGQHFWARGYFVSTVGRDEEVIREYIRNEEQEDKRLEQLNLWR